MLEHALTIAFYDFHTQRILETVGLCHQLRHGLRVLPLESARLMSRIASTYKI